MVPVCSVARVTVRGGERVVEGWGRFRVRVSTGYG